MSNELQNHLTSLPPGLVEDTGALVRLLAEEWKSLQGSEAGGMQADKLFGRCEKLTWQPPFLTFVIERHGGTVNGSTRGELQHWKIDVFSRAAVIVKSGHRQLYQMGSRFDVKGPAREIADAVINQKDSPSLKWYPDGRVHVIAKTLLPEGAFNRTDQGRRKKLKAELELLLAPHGWVFVDKFIFKRSDNP